MARINFETLDNAIHEVVEDFAFKRNEYFISINCNSSEPMRLIDRSVIRALGYGSELLDDEDGYDEYSYDEEAENSNEDDKAFDPVYAAYQAYVATLKKIINDRIEYLLTTGDLVVLRRKSALAHHIITTKDYWNYLTVFNDDVASKYTV